MTPQPFAESQDDIYQRLRLMVRDVDRQPDMIGVLSTGERIAVALVLNDASLLPTSYSSILEAVDRLGETWLAAAHRVQRDGWSS